MGTREVGKSKVKLRKTQSHGPQVLSIFVLTIQKDKICTRITLVSNEPIRTLALEFGQVFGIILALSIVLARLTIAACLELTMYARVFALAGACGQVGIFWVQLTFAFVFARIGITPVLELVSE